MATIRKRRGSYQVQIRKNGYPQITKTFIDRNTALSWANKAENEIEREDYLDISVARKTALSEVLDRYEREILPSKKAGESELPGLQRLKAELGDYSLIDIQPYLVAQYRDRRLELVQPASVRRESGALSRVLNAALKDWGISLPQGNSVRCGHDTDRLHLPNDLETRSIRTKFSYQGTSTSSSLRLRTSSPDLASIGATT